jgi:hypothetical protein
MTTTKQSKITWDKIPTSFSEQEPSENAKWVNLEVINFPYSELTMNYICEIAHFCERLNFGSYTLFRIFWDILKNGFIKLSSENKLRMMKTICESNLNLLFFEDEVADLVELFVYEDEGNLAEMGWRCDDENNLKSPGNEKFDDRLEFFNTAFGQK